MNKTVAYTLSYLLNIAGMIFTIILSLIIGVAIIYGLKSFEKTALVKMDQSSYRQELQKAYINGYNDGRSKLHMKTVEQFAHAGERE